MPATTPNIAKGRVNELVRRVSGDDPATSGFVVVLLQDTGIEALTALRDHDTLAEILAGTNTECGVASYARLVLTEVEITDPTVDDGADTQDWDTGDFDFGALESGESLQGAVICYAPDTTGADSTFIPVHITRLDTPVDTNGEIFHYRTPNGLFSAGE